MTEQALIEERVKQAILDVAEAGHLEPGAQVVLGCSTSEIAGGRIGHASVPEIGEWVARAALDACAEKGFVPIFQCCEHLNRSLVMPLNAAKAAGYTRVNAVPQPKAGGSVPAAAWKMMDTPCLVTHVQADAGVDIGDTLIGMHLRPVAVPFRGEIREIGLARVVCAYSRLPYVGGARAVYE